MKKHKETQQLFKDKQTEHRVVATILTGLAIYFSFQIVMHFLIR